MPPKKQSNMPPKKQYKMSVKAKDKMSVKAKDKMSVKAKDNISQMPTLIMFDAEFFDNSISMWQKNKYKYRNQPINLNEGKGILQLMSGGKLPSSVSVVNKKTHLSYYNTNTDSPFTLEDLIKKKSHKNANVYSPHTAIWTDCGYCDINGIKCIEKGEFTKVVLSSHDYDHEKYTQVYFCASHKKFEKEEIKKREALYLIAKSRTHRHFIEQIPER